MGQFSADSLVRTVVDLIEHHRDTIFLVTTILIIVSITLHKQVILHYTNGGITNAHKSERYGRAKKETEDSN